MILSPANDTPDGVSPPVVAEPACLRRRGPARLDITFRGGDCVPVVQRRLFVRAGRTLVVQIVPQNASATVTVVAESPLFAVMPVSRIEGGGTPTYHGEFTGHSPFRVIPLPTTAMLHVSLADGLPNPPRLTIPVTVWPSLWTFALWWLVAFCSILGTRWQPALAKSVSAWDIFAIVFEDIPFVTQLAVLGVGISIVLRVLGLLVSLGGTYGEEEA